MEELEFRQAVNKALAEWFETNAPECFIQWENGPEYDAPEDEAGPWFDVSLRYYGGNTASLGGRPVARLSGTISIYLYQRQGEGTYRVDELLGGLARLLRHTNFGPARTSAPQRSAPQEHLGWYKTGLFVPFTLDIMS